MTLQRFAMIIKGPGYDPAVHRAQMASAHFSTDVICVSTVEQAFACAQQLVANGVQLIELCGGFSAENALALELSIGGRVPVGLVQYSAAQQLRLGALFQ
jgi:hypothetical protein